MSFQLLCVDETKFLDAELNTLGYAEIGYLFSAQFARIIFKKAEADFIVFSVYRVQCQFYHYIFARRVALCH
jgi:hypothetical protein